ncbi:MAG: ABC transporter permease [Anaerolineales bacterium]|nr:MAG: ABC transporter permease [Anaerolineales bacterium]
MRIGRYEFKLEKRLSLTGWKAAIISIFAVIFALALFSFIFILAEINPLLAYREMFSYAFVNPYGLPLTINRFIFLLLCTSAFIIPFRAGLWNIGMPGQLYAGALGAFAVLYAFGVKDFRTSDLSPGILIPLMLIVAALGGVGLGAIAGVLKGKFNINEIVVTMILNFIAFWLVSHMIKEGGPFMNPGGRGESFELPSSLYPPMIMGVPFTIFLALGVAVLLYFMFAKTRIGYKIKAHGLSPAASRYAGISTFKIPLLVFIMGGALAGWAGYHYFAAVPGVYKISRNYGYFGDLAFYGIICGLISLGNPLAAIPVALLFGGLSVGGRFVQGQLNMSFGLDYALLGVLMITLVAFQFFYRYQIGWAKTGEERLDVGVLR